MVIQHDTLTCGLVELVLNGLNASAFLCISPHTFYVLLSDCRVKMSRGSTQSRGDGMSIGYRTQISIDIKLIKQ